MNGRINMDRLRNRHFLLSDLLLLPVAVYVAYILRFEEFGPASHWWQGMFLLGVSVLCITPVVFRQAGVYARFWRYASVDELTMITGALTGAVIGASAVTILLGMVTIHALIIPRSIPFILLLTALSATAGPRFFVRVWVRRVNRGFIKAADVIKVVIMGAGDAGALIARELQQNPQLGLDAVGFLDDNPAKCNMVIHGLPVLGDRFHIDRLVRTYAIQQVIIAMPTAPGKEIRNVVSVCEQAGVQTRIVPGVYELLGGTLSLSKVRNVEIEDLLRREPIRSDIAAVRRLVAGKRVLITGGGGSIGSELARQVYLCGPEELVLMGHGENSIFDIFHELDGKQVDHLAVEHEQLNGFNSAAKPVKLRAMIADIRFAERIQSVLEEVRPQIIFHTAAHKHVPLMEMNPAEAILNNVIGTQTLVNAARANGVERLVMISTDKAVRPTSIMGATKRVAELLVHAIAAESGLPYVAVRFGNVLGSRGSVVQTFRRQIAAGGPVTVTHRDVKRYFMSIPEAVQLVLQASVMGTGGEAFVLDMGEPIRIVDLATDLIRLSGLELGRDIDIVFTGLRQGEKLFEELFAPGEEYHRTQHAQIFVAANASRFVPPDLNERIDALHVAAKCSDYEAIISNLKSLIPEFTPVGTSVVGQGRQAPAINCENQVGVGL